MHKKYARDGLCCISVSVDTLDRKNAALKFLQQQGAVFSNYLLDEETDFWQNKFDLNGPPAVFVFDRDNRRAAKFDTSDPDKPYTYRDVEAVVRKLLSAKRLPGP